MLAVGFWIIGSVFCVPVISQVSGKPVSLSLVGEYPNVTERASVLVFLLAIME
jgi:hypothetical protein